MNTDKRLVINHLKRGRVNQLKQLYENFGGQEIMRKKDYIEKFTPILLNKIYDRRHEVIVHSFLTTLENREDLKRVIPRICHEETIIPEENLRELIRIFNRARYPTPQWEIVKIRKLYKFPFKKINIFTIKRYIYSIDDEDNEERYFDIWLSHFHLLSIPYIV